MTGDGGALPGRGARRIVSERGAIVKGMTRAAVIGLALLGLGVAAALLVMGQGGAEPSAAQLEIEPYFKCYNIAAPTPGVGTPTPTPIATVDLETQFGIETAVPVEEPSVLCLPAGQNGSPTPGPEVRHTKCYNIAGLSPGESVKLITHWFGTENNVAVGQPKFLCVSVTKTLMGTPVGPPPTPYVDYKCYDIAPPTPGVGTPTPIATVDLETQFGIETGVVVEEPSVLCLPAGENGTPVPGPEQPHFKCYDIAVPTPGAGTPTPTPIPEVNLSTHFGVEPNVQVLQPISVCVPVIKQVLTPPPSPTRTPTPTPTPTSTPWDTFTPTPTPTATPTHVCGNETPEAPWEQCDPPGPVAKDNQCPNWWWCEGAVYCELRYAPSCTAQCQCHYDYGAIDRSCVIGQCGADCVTDADCFINYVCRGCNCVHTGVGGIAELPPLAGASAEGAAAPAQGSGWSSANYAALVGGLAAAVVVLSAGGWYARRRWIR